MPYRAILVVQVYSHTTSLDLCLSTPPQEYQDYEKEEYDSASNRSSDDRSLVGVAATVAATP